MFLHRVIFRPLPGKGPALRTLLASGQRPGRWNLVERLAGPSPSFQLQFFYDSLAALDEASKQPPSADLLKLGTELPTLGAAAPATELDEVVTTLPEGPAANYVVRTVYEVAPGKMRDLRTLLDELIAQRAADGSRMNLAVRVTGGPPAMTLTGFHQDLASVETTRAKVLADPAGPQRVQHLSALLAHPAPLPDIFRVVARSA